MWYSEGFCCASFLMMVWMQPWLRRKRSLASNFEWIIVTCSCEFKLYFAEMNGKLMSSDTRKQIDESTAFTNKSNETKRKKIDDVLTHNVHMWWYVQCHRHRSCYSMNGAFFSFFFFFFPSLYGSMCVVLRLGSQVHLWVHHMTWWCERLEIFFNIPSLFAHLSRSCRDTMIHWPGCVLHRISTYLLS